VPVGRGRAPWVVGVPRGSWACPVGRGRAPWVVGVPVGRGRPHAPLAAQPDPEPSIPVGGSDAGRLSERTLDIFGAA